MPIDHPPRPPYNDPSQSPPPHDQHGIPMAKKPTPQPPKDITIPLKVLNPWVEFTDAIFHCPEESKEKGGITISVHITLPIRLTQTPTTCWVRPIAGVEFSVGRRLSPARDPQQ